MDVLFLLAALLRVLAPQFAPPAALTAGESGK